MNIDLDSILFVLAIIVVYILLVKFFEKIETK